MPSRATTTDLLSRVQRRVRREVNAAAGGNELVSKREQRGLETLLNDVATDLRAADGPGARLQKQELVDAAVAAVEALVSGVNQPSGSGAAFVSAGEVKAALATNPVVGARVAKAYQLITGRRVTADAPPPPGVTGQLGDARLTQARLDTITDHARRVASSGDLMTGAIPPGHYIILPVLEGDRTVPQGRSYAVYIRDDGPGSDPNRSESMSLEAIDGAGVVRTASFPVPLDGPPALVAGDVQGIVEAPIDGLAAWHDSGDHGVNVTSHPLPGVARLDVALDRARRANAWTTNERHLAFGPLAGDAAIDSFLGQAESTLLDMLPSGEDPAAVASFALQVRASFSQLDDVRLAKGDDLGGLYLVGKTADGYIAVVVQSYSDA